MLTLWSEVPVARAVELAADSATLLWIAAWIMVSQRLYAVLAEFARAGRAIRQGGENLDMAAKQIGSALGSIPVIGHNVGDLVRSAIAFAARPFLAVGTDLERILLFIATLVSVLVLLLALTLWLIRYVPWRWKRLERLHTAARVMRAAPQISGSAIERLLASRALHRLSYGELLKYSPDPFGDWIAGRYGRLAQAELGSVGLRPRSAQFLSSSRSNDA